MKALNNFLGASAYTTAVEALAIGKEFGLDPRGDAGRRQLLDRPELQHRGGAEGRRRHGPVRHRVRPRPAGQGRGHRGRPGRGGGRERPGLPAGQGPVGGGGGRRSASPPTTPRRTSSGGRSTSQRTRALPERSYMIIGGMRYRRRQESAMLSFAQATGALDKLIDRDQDFRLLGTGFGFTEGPAWNTAGQLPDVQRHPRRPALALERAGRHGAGRVADLQGQRHGVRGRRQPAGLRAGHELAHPDPAGRAPAGRRLPLPGQVPEQPQRRHRPFGRKHLLHRPELRPLAGGRRRRPRVRARLPGRVPGAAGRRRRRARGGGEGVRAAERAVLLARRKHPVRQRPAEPQGLRRRAGRVAVERADRARPDGQHRGAGQRQPGRDGVRRARQRLVHRARRDLGHRPGRRPARHHRDARGVRQPGLGR